MNPRPVPSRPRPWLTVLAPLAGMLALSFGSGCSKLDATTAPDAVMFNQGAELPPAPILDPSGAYAGDEYAFTDALAEGESLAVERSVVAMAGASRNEHDYDDFDQPPARDAKGKANEAARRQAEKNAQKQADAQADGADAGETKADADDDDQKPDHGRQIIYVAGLQVSVFDLDNAMAIVEALPDRYGGWVHMRTQNQVVLRLPAPSLKPVMATVAELGVVEARTLNAQDVTAEYVDLESRIKVLRDTQAQLLELLGQSKTVEEALHVRNALDNVTMELEMALGRMRQLDDMITFSTLTVTLVERGPQDRIPTHNDPFGWVDRLGVEATEWR